MAGLTFELNADGADHVVVAQATFRTVMTALARPARVSELPLHARSRDMKLGSLYPSSVALLLALADFETSIWLAPELTEAPTCDVLRFETGARIIDEPSEADFAVVSALHEMPPLTTFKSGTAEYPDRSALVVVQVRGFDGAGSAGTLTIAGPGIVDRTELRIDPGLPEFARQWQTNRAGFPCGVDLVFATPRSIAALPRSARLIETR
jgi:alpha-D-ribose 1-methylphosphonate 5-triphosphate synthase subunit PhnH